MNGLIPISTETVKAASITCAEAFKDDPLTLYTLPDADKRPNLRYGCEYSLRLAILNGADAFATSAACEGIAVWRDSLKQPSFTTFLRVNPLLRLRCGWSYIVRDEYVNRLLENAKGKVAPRHHLYLGLLAVNPASQGQGYAGTLLRGFLTDMERKQLPGYLETQNLKNTQMYEHFGFRVVKTVRIPRSELDLFLMLRER